MKKKLTFLLICPLWPGGGLKPLADISAKNVSFFDVSPQQSEGVAQIRLEACKNKKMPFPKKNIFSLWICVQMSQNISCGKLDFCGKKLYICIFVLNIYFVPKQDLFLIIELWFVLAQCFLVVVPLKNTLFIS